MSGSTDALAGTRARELVGLFHHDLDRFGTLAPVPAEEMPRDARRLLDHTSHMTVAMDRFHDHPVSLRVVNRRDCPDGRYAREILLHLPDGCVVQHGIVRIDLAAVTPETAAAIRDEGTPLGRILLAAGLHCDVHDVQLLQISTGPHLASLFQVDVATPTFGRVALIGLAGRPAIELLEIIAPVLG